MWLLLAFVRERRLRKQAYLTGRLPIRSVLPHEIDPVFATGPHGPTRATEVAFIGRGQYDVAGGTSDAEAWILAVLAKGARRIFEFGTCTGKTTYLFARNAPSDAIITTVTLGPGDVQRYQRGAHDSRQETRFAMEESAFTEFLYSHTDVECKIVQLFADSKELDVAPWRRSMDIVFIDGSHAYSYVVSDSSKAMEMVAAGGLILWHDYAGRSHAPGAYRALNELARRTPLVRIEGTSLIAYRQPVA